jgi:hypothetical protein
MEQDMRDADWFIIKLVLLFMCGVGVGWMNPLEVMCR